MTPEQNALRARLANAARFHPDDADQAESLRRELKASRLTDHVRAAVDSLPPLTLEQRTRIAALLLRADAA